MIVIWILIVFVYVAFLINFAERSAFNLEAKAVHALKEEEKFYEDLIKNRDTLHEEKMELENEALRIFTLYDMTKQITKTFNEQGAFEIFQEKLRQNVNFKECLLLDPLSERVNQLNREENFIFPLQEKNKPLGYLLLRGLSKEDQEKAMILGHQFALALRRIKLYEEIEKTAITDSLTEIYTRRYFLERLQEEFKRSKKRDSMLSLLMIDVDFFKSFNDQYGHLVGDKILRDVGYMIKQTIREIDFAGRYGGEEFSVVLPDTDNQGAQLAAERIRKVIEETLIKAYDTAINVTVSVGLTTFPADGKTAEELMDKADWALYRAKKLGRNKVCAFGVYSHDNQSL